MSDLKITIDPRVADKFAAYPKEIQPKIDYLRSLIIETATENETVTSLEETLKWGEPSYLAKKGSTIRIDWKAKSPNQYAIYFKCTSKLVTTFREVYGDTFNYEKNRAIRFNLEDEVPKEELKSCIQAALNYHSLKDLPRLGI
jgi:uncharacterized protein YdhG (YjbR/CyaY superfamily)